MDAHPDTERHAAPPLEARIAALRARIARLPRRLWWLRPRVFGAATHRYRLAPPASAREVAAFEDRVGQELPADYRAFLTAIAGGGAGPCYGLLPLQDWCDELLGDEPGPLAGRPCTLSPAVAWPPRDASDDRWLCAIGGDDWRQRLDRGEWHPLQGTVPVAYEGCAGYAALVLDGVCRGRVCSVDLDLHGVRLLPQADFLSWYEGWLDAVLRWRRVGASGW